MRRCVLLSRAWLKTMSKDHSRAPWLRFLSYVIVRRVSCPTTHWDCLFQAGSRVNHVRVQTGIQGLHWPGGQFILSAVPITIAFAEAAARADIQHDHDKRDNGRPDNKPLRRQ